MQLIHRRPRKRFHLVKLIDSQDQKITIIEAPTTFKVYSTKTNLDIHQTNLLAKHPHDSSTISNRKNKSQHLIPTTSRTRLENRQ